MTLAIMLVDVSVNSWVALNYPPDVGALIAQYLFLLFVVVTAAIVWRAESNKDMFEGLSEATLSRFDPNIQ